MTSPEAEIREADVILGAWAATVGRDFDGYRNHVRRVIRFCLAQGEFDAGERRRIVIAACFHDLGIWSAGTFDYLPPSIALATEYLAAHGLGEWAREVADMIDQHHRLRPAIAPAGRLTEVLRRADLVDVSLGLVGCGIAAETRREVRREYPNAGFHRCLLRVSARWLLRHPLRPVPVLKW